MAKSIYNPQTIEPKWQSTWENKQLFQDSASASKTTKNREDKLYLLFAFAYPSGSGLHVGHVESKTALDILARYSRMKGKQVFFPVGWDAFGLPAENYAIKTGIHPATTTKDAITTFRRQIKRLAISYDWANELATNHPEYYRWTQWIFIQLFKAGLAYRKKGLVNWCPNDKTVLANEQVVNGACERCGAEVVQKELEQWFFKITEYKDELISGLDTVDWPEPTKQQQLNWIGKSEGLQIEFSLKGVGQVLPIWTKFWETVFGTTFLVIAPEKFEELGLLKNVEQSKKTAVEAYLEASKKKTEEQRRVGEKDKTGVDTGLVAINPVNGAEVPLFIADYVLTGVGTAIVMGVPSHDARDFAFAKKFNLGLQQVVAYEDISLNDKVASGEISHEGEGVLVNSGQFDGKSAWGEGKTLMAEWMITQGYAEWKTTYKLRDWLISRQRYWGAPIPMTYCEDCAKAGKGENKDMPGWFAVPEESLPVRLPEIEDFKPTDEGKSPIEKAEDSWKYTTCPGCGGSKAKREVDTMDTFVDSSWYFMRYTDSRNSDVFAKQEQLEYWLPVDFYMIGPEHIVLHLLYSRFFTKFLRDQGYLNFDEPFMKMRHQGMILGPDNKKMSKSKGNVINPDEIIEKFGADTLRVYEMFMGPIESDKPWNMRAVAGVYRFLTRVYNLTMEAKDKTKSESASTAEASPVRRKLHQTIQKITQDIPELKFNTAIAAMMEFINVWEQAGENADLSQEEVQSFIKILAPFAPFLADELYHEFNSVEESIHESTWPSFDATLATENELTIAIQVNGKLRDELVVSREAAADKNQVLELARASEKVQKWLSDKELIKEIYVPEKIVNLVVR